MELAEVGRAVARRRWAAAAVCAAVVVAWLATTLLAHPPSSASATLLVQPTTAGLDVEQYALAVLPVRVASPAFAARVAATLPPGTAHVAVTLSGASNQTTGILTVSAVAPDAAAATAWADAAAEQVATSLSTEVAAGVGTVTLSHAATTRSGGRVASGVGALGLGGILAVLAALALDAWPRRPGRAERLARRWGVPVIGAGGAAALGDLLARSTRPVFVLASEARGARRPALAVRFAGDVARHGRPATVLAVSPSRSFESLRSRLKPLVPTVEAPAGRRGRDAPPVDVRRVGIDTLASDIDRCVARGSAVVVDSPPIEEARSDALASLLSGTVLVVADLASATAASTAATLRRLDVLGVPVSGVVLDEPPPRSRPAPAASGPSGLPRRMVRNVVSVYGSTALAGVALLVLTPFALHRLGRDAYGVYALLQTVSEYVLLANVGFGTATLKLVAEDAGRDRARVLRTFNTSVFVLAAFAAVALAASLLGSLAMPAVLGVPAHLRTDTVIAFVILALAITPQLPGSALTGIIMGFQRYDIESLLDSVGIVVTAGGTLVAIAAGFGIVGAAAAIATGYVVMVIIPWWPARGLVPGLRLSPRLVDRQQLRRMTGLSGWYLVENLSNVVIAEADLLLVAILLGVRQVALFAVAFQLSRLAAKAIGPFSAVFFPHVSSVSSAGAPGESPAALRQIFRDGTRVTMAVAVPAALTVALLAGPAVRAWVGGGFGGAGAVVALLSAAGAVFALGTVGTQILVGLGQARTASVIGGATAVVHIAASVALAGPYGPAGVAAGSLLSLALVFTPLTLLAAARQSGERLSDWLAAVALPHLVPAVVTSGMLLLVGRRLGASPVAVVAAGVAAFAVYLVTYLAVGATPDEKAAVTGRLRRIAP